MTTLFSVTEHKHYPQVNNAKLGLSLHFFLVRSKLCIVLTYQNYIAPSLSSNLQGSEEL